MPAIKHPRTFQNPHDMGDRQSVIDYREGFNDGRLNRQRHLHSRTEAYEQGLQDGREFKRQFDLIYNANNETQ